MQQQNFKRNLIAASVAMTLGISGTSFAATNSGPIEPQGAAKPSISNKAIASYSVDGVEQPQVESNEVTVTISPVAQFKLVGLLGSSASDDKNENIATVPEGKATFQNKLTNLGNKSDTYTLTLKDEDDQSITTAANEYTFKDVADIKMKVQKYKSTGDVKVGTPIEVANGGTVTLDKGEYAVITYEAETPTDALGGQTSTLTLSATSEEIATIDASKKTLVNENQTFVQVPSFKIQKTALTQTGANLTRIDLNKINKFSYKIIVTNDSTKTYTTDVINALIQDTLPAGIDLDETASIIRTPQKGELDTSKTTPEGRRIISLNKVNLAKGESIEITIPVKITDKDTLATAGNATNHADVYDNYDDTPVDPSNPDDADIHDSTDNNNDTPRVKDDDDDDTTQELPTSKRSITIGNGTTNELPRTSAPNSPATYENTITNNGTEDETGVKFTIKDPAGNQVDVTNPKFTKEDGTVIELKEDPAGSGTYVAKDGSPITIPKGTTGKLTYDVVTNDATKGDYPIVVDVIPAPGDNKDAPEVEEKTSTLQVRDLKLVKEHAIDAACDGTADSAFTQDAINTAVPGQCIIYKITANNNFTTKALTNVKVTDAASQWNKGATYIENSVTVSSNGQITERPVNNAGSVKATFATIPAAQTGWVQFGVQINK